MTSLDTLQIARLRASHPSLPRHTIGGLIPFPFALLPGEPGEWIVYREGRPACAGPLAVVAVLADLHPATLTLYLDPAVSPDEALMDEEARGLRQRGRQAAHVLAQQRLAQIEADRRAEEARRRERERIARIDLRTVSLDDL